MSNGLCRPSAAHPSPGSAPFAFSGGTPSTPTCSSGTLDYSAFDKISPGLGKTMAESQAACEALLSAAKVSREPTRCEVPKALTPINNPRHFFTWAATPLSIRALSRYKTSLDAAAMAELCPTAFYAYDEASKWVKPDVLLQDFENLEEMAQGRQLSISPIDVAEAYVRLLTHLVRAVAAHHSLHAATSSATQYLLNAMAHAETSGNAFQARIRAVWRRYNSPASRPTDPFALLHALASEFVPYDPFFSAEEDYQLYLAGHYTLASLDSLPSSVWLQAGRLASFKHEVGTVDHADEAKQLFVSWIRQHAKKCRIRCSLLEPITGLFEEGIFQEQPFDAFLSRLQVMEAESNSLSSLVLFLGDCDAHGECEALQEVYLDMAERAERANDEDQNESEDFDPNDFAHGDNDDFDPSDFE